MSTVRMAAQQMRNGALVRWTPEKVQEAPDPALAFAEYAQQTLGIPWPTAKDLAILRKKAKEIFDDYPRADWVTMCKLVQWAKSRRKRFGRVWMLLDAHREAWAAKFVPELDYREFDEEIEALIKGALAVETRESWRSRFLRTASTTAQRKAYEEWLEDQPPGSTVGPERGSA